MVVKILDTILVGLTLFPGAYFIIPLIRIFFLITILIFQDFKDHFNWAFVQLLITFVYLLGSVAFLPFLPILLIAYIVVSIIPIGL